MSVEGHIQEQIEFVRKYVEENFGDYVGVEMDYFNDFWNEVIKSSLSIKIWINNLFNNQSIFSNDSIDYLREIVSNTNQVIILGTLGFRLASCALIRRSLENILAFLYYKDHPIELFKKNILSEYKKKTKELKDYLCTYPFEMLYRDKYNSNNLRNLVGKAIELWDEEYKNLSNFIHATNKKYFELINYIDEIGPQIDMLNYLKNSIKKMSTIVNLLNVLFFFADYKEFSREQKTLIRFSIDDQRLKQKVVDIFGEI